MFTWMTKDITQDWISIRWTKHRRNAKREIPKGSPNTALSLQVGLLQQEDYNRKGGIHHAQTGTELKPNTLHSLFALLPAPSVYLFKSSLTNAADLHLVVQKQYKREKTTQKTPKIYLHFLSLLSLWINDSEAPLAVSEGINPSALHTLMPL